MRLKEMSSTGVLPRRERDERTGLHGKIAAAWMAWRLQGRDAAGRKRVRPFTRDTDWPATSRELRMCTEFKTKRGNTWPVALPLLALIAGLLMPAALVQAAPQQGAPLPS